MTSGTPSAFPLAEPKLLVMSVRTTPDTVSTSGPLDPSPGNGPAVSSGIVSQLAADATAAVDADGGAADAVDAPDVAAVAAAVAAEVVGADADADADGAARSACVAEGVLLAA